MLNYTTDHLARHAGGVNRALRIAVVGAALAACGDPSDPARPATTGAARSTSVQQPAWALETEAVRVRSEAVAGVRRRGEQDEMLKLEAQLPGFGGFYVDSLGEVVFFLKPTTIGAPTAATVRDVAHRLYQTRSNPAVRTIMAAAERAEVREGQYSLSELVAVEQRVLATVSRLNSFAGVGASLFLNRVKVGFRSESDVASGMAAVEAAGVPRGAVVPEVWGEVRSLSTWSSLPGARPTRGGIKIQLPGTYPKGGSHGFNVRAVNTGVDYFMTAAHLANSTTGITGTNGLTGVPVYQPSYSGGVIGDIAINPLWTQSPGCSGYAYCTIADVALGTFSGGVTGDRRVGTSVTEGNGGNPGSQQISNWYPIAGVLEPEFVQVYHNIVHKSGQKTGTTTGGIDLTCAYIPATIQWGPTTILMLHECVTRVAFAGVGFGDSGGPVFARAVTGGSYYALGIVVAGGPLPDGDEQSICVAGQACHFVFAQWSAIENKMGLGPLNPAT